MTIRIGRIAVQAALAVLPLLASSALPASAQSAAELEAKAKSEGQVVLYVGGPTAPWEAMAKQFNVRYPG